MRRCNTKKDAELLGWGSNRNFKTNIIKLQIIIRVLLDYSKIPLETRSTLLYYLNYVIFFLYLRVVCFYNFAYYV